jgi:hypothetical protein
MTMQGRRALFFLAAIAANVLATGAIFVLILLAYRLTLARVISPSGSTVVLILAFLAAELITSLAYGRVLDWARRKWKLDEALGLGPRKPAK